MGNCASYFEPSNLAAVQARDDTEVAELRHDFGNDLSSKLEIKVRCRNLKNMDSFSKSDPMVVAYLRDKTDSNNPNWTEIGRTEVIMNNLNPDFVKGFLVDYNFERQEDLKFVVYDIDDFTKGAALTSHDLLGSCELSIHDLAATLTKTLTRPLLSQNGAREGNSEILIVAEEIHYAPNIYRISMSASQLPKMDFFGSCDGYFVLSRISEGGEKMPVYRSEVVKNSPNPKWTTMQSSMTRLCNGDEDQRIVVDVFDWNRAADDDIVGSWSGSVREASESVGRDLPLKLDSKKNSKSRGFLRFDSIDQQKRHTFLEYVQGGCEIGAIIAIDFTASNGDPRQAQSLHYDHPGQGSVYERAITSVCSILNHYDSDSLYPSYGFGAHFGDRRVNHCFPLNGRSDNAEVVGVGGIREAYRQALTRATLYGPTLFAPVISQACQMASGENTQDDQHYEILLIITDGVISDMSNTVSEIVRASELPLSIIIVGVGNADFTNMEILDADDERLESNGRRQARDNVQFVRFADWEGKSEGLLAREVLEEIPGQLIGYFESKGIAPGSRRPTAPQDGTFQL